MDGYDMIVPPSGIEPFPDFDPFFDPSAGLRSVTESTEKSLSPDAADAEGKELVKPRTTCIKQKQLQAYILRERLRGRDDFAKAVETAMQEKIAQRSIPEVDTLASDLSTLGLSQWSLTLEPYTPPPPRCPYFLRPYHRPYPSHLPLPSIPLHRPRFSPTLLPLRTRDLQSAEYADALDTTLTGIAILLNLNRMRDSDKLKRLEHLVDVAEALWRGLKRKLKEDEKMSGEAGLDKVELDMETALGRALREHLGVERVGWGVWRAWKFLVDASRVEEDGRGVWGH